LSAAMVELGAGSLVDVAAGRPEFANADVAHDDDFTRLLEVSVDWVAGAPPCKTFSRARRKDQFASVRQLRSDERPEGFGDKVTEEGNLLAHRMLELALRQVKQGKFFSIENPLLSFMWSLKRFRKLRETPGVRFVSVAQCACGSLHKKETGLLTNAPWLVDVPCDMATRPHHHVPLIGFVEDYRANGADKVFFTELAAEYPEGLCNRWAKDWFAWWSAQRPMVAHCLSSQVTSSGDSPMVAHCLSSQVTSCGDIPVVAHCVSSQVTAGERGPMAAHCWSSQVASGALPVAKQACGGVPVMQPGSPRVMAVIQPAIRAGVGTAPRCLPRYTGMLSAAVTRMLSAAVVRAGVG